MTPTLKHSLNLSHTEAVFVPLFPGEDVQAKLACLPEPPVGLDRLHLPRGGDRWWASLLPSSGVRVFLVQAGKRSDGDALPLLAGQVLSLAREFHLKRASLLLGGQPPLSHPEVLSLFDYLRLGAYRFDRYKKKEGAPPRLELVLPGQERFPASLLARQAALLDRVDEVRNLVNTPASELTPDHFTERILALAGPEISCRVLRRTELERERMAGILAVGAGSPVEPALIRLEYAPTQATRSVALIGKGVTFDAGGLNLKPGTAMEEMKSDMAGAAAVLGTVLAARDRALPVRVTGWLPLAENLPGRNAVKPGDILRFANGKTVEIVNTDAEGRLLLADALIAAGREKPEWMISLSTLTGAMVAALGDQFAGLLCRSPRLGAALLAAGERTRERLWAMPLHDGYRGDIRSQVADLKNANYHGASALKAGLFLEEFAGRAPFAHLDIAGTAFLSKANRLLGEGATGFGVRLLVDFLEATPTKVRRAD